MTHFKIATIDLREFHPFVKQELEKYQFLSPRLINENTISTLIDPVISTLFFLKHNFNICSGVGSRSQLHQYYTLEDFIEIFDDLQIAFSTFLTEKGISSYKSYRVFRPDSFRTVFINYERVLHV